VPRAQALGEGDEGPHLKVLWASGRRLRSSTQVCVEIFDKYDCDRHAGRAMALIELPELYDVMEMKIRPFLKRR